MRVQQSMAHGTIVDDEPCIEELLESLNDGIHVLHTVFSFIVLLISVYTLYILISCRITTMSRNVQGGFDQCCVYVCICVRVFVCSCVCTCVYVRVQQPMAHGTIVDDEPCIEELLESLNDGIHVLHTVFSFIVLLISVYTLYILISCRITTMSRNVQGGFDQCCCQVSPSRCYKMITFGI